MEEVPLPVAARASGGHTPPGLRVEDFGREIRSAVAQYATAVDGATRTSLRARVLGLIEKLVLSRASAVTTSEVSPEELRADAVLRGAILMHLDLVFRASVTAAELLFTATKGTLRIASHEALEDFPVGVVLAMPTRGLVRERRELFEEPGPAPGGADVMTIFALATSPPKLGAGARLLAAVKDDCARQAPPLRVVAFSPLTGLRARVIRLVDDEEAWRESLAAHPAIGDQDEVLREQLFDLLARDTLPDYLPEPAQRWLSEEAQTFAASREYAVGNFHQSMGANLLSVVCGGDPKDSDAMWARAFFDYGKAS